MVWYYFNYKLAVLTFIKIEPSNFLRTRNIVSVTPVIFDTSKHEVWSDKHAFIFSQFNDFRRWEKLEPANCNITWEIQLEIFDTLAHALWPVPRRLLPNWGFSSRFWWLWQIHLRSNEAHDTLGNNVPHPYTIIHTSVLLSSYNKKVYKFTTADGWDRMKLTLCQ